MQGIFLIQLYFSQFKLGAELDNCLKSSPDLKFSRSTNKLGPDFNKFQLKRLSKQVLNKNFKHTFSPLRKPDICFSQKLF